MALLRGNLEPTDFADADCRVTKWYDFDGHGGVNGYRIWMCKCTHHWFQRHEWSIEGKNQTEMGEWIYSGYDWRRTWDGEWFPAPDVRDI